MSGLALTVYHCGGRGGAHPTWRRFPAPVRYVCFEPESDGFADLGASDKADGLSLLAEPTALDAEPGERKLNVYSSPDLSSFLELDPHATHRYGLLGVHRVRELGVDCDTIDRVAARRKEDPDFLCLDTQGTELAILRGATDVLRSSVLGVRCEVEFLPLYRDQPLFGEVFAFLRSQGFRLVRLERTGSGAYGMSTDAGPFSLGEDDAAPAWADAIFFRDLDTVVGDTQAATARRLAKLFLIALTHHCGAVGLEYLWRVGRKHRLRELWAELDPRDAARIVALARTRLDEVERGSWQRDARYLEAYERVRAELRAELPEG